MKVSNIKNSQTFRGLNISKVTRHEDMNRVIKPCLKELKILAKKVDIEIESSTLVEEFEHFKSPRQVLNITIKPIKKTKERIAKLTNTIFLNDENVKDKSILDVIKRSINTII